MSKVFKLQSEFKPAGDQPRAIKSIASGLSNGLRHQTLLGVTGSGKTFTMANVIASQNKPVLVIAHNKTLAAQLAQEYMQFFPHNAVHYFVSYYDYYIPESYMPATDTYIEKDANINTEIDRLRHASTQALLARRDVIIVASVSCIYGLGSPKEYKSELLSLSVDGNISRHILMRKLISVYFERTTADLIPGKFRSVGNTVEVVPTAEEVIIRFEFEDGFISRIQKIDFITRKVREELQNISIFPAKHFVTTESRRKKAIKSIKIELTNSLKNFKTAGELLPYERLKRRTNYDLRMISEVGYVKGIENYSRHLSGRNEGDPPDTLLSYFPKDKDGRPDFLTIVDESHVTVPQIRGMYLGDASRKKTLIKYGFRLPSALDNRPLTFDEFNERVGQLVYTSATPSEYELNNSADIIKNLQKDTKDGENTPLGIVEQIIRPTGLLDPELAIKPIISNGSYEGQIADLIDEVEKTTKLGERSIATTLTKKMAEDLSEYLGERGIKTKYLHSEIKTLDRIQILTEFRRGDFDCLVGVNLLREGLDLPEVSFIGILDADKEGFLRSETSLIQTIGRAARNVSGRVVLYADRITGSIERAVEETRRRRIIQLEYNKKNKITPKTISKKIKDITEDMASQHKRAVFEILEIDKIRLKDNPKALLKEKNSQMNDAAKKLDFETAAILRDEIKAIMELIKK
jgi:excinuclease ABC subunit B